jgi:hypothetical protein
LKNYIQRNGFIVQDPREEFEFKLSLRGKTVAGYTKAETLEEALRKLKEIYVEHELLYCTKA